MSDNDDGNVGTVEDTFLIFGYYCVYFVGFVFTALLFDRVGCFDHFGVRLGNLAHTSFLKYERKYLLKKKGKEIDPHADPPKGGCCKRTNIKVAPEEIITAQTEEKPKKGFSFTTLCCCCCKLTCWLCCGNDECDDWNPTFVKKLLSKDAYYGIPDDSLCGRWFCCSSGMWADFIFFLFNHHTVLSMFACSKQNAFSRTERKIAFFVQHCMAFLFAALVILADATPIQALMLNMFVITPISMLVNTLYYYMLACPCLIHEWQWAFSAWCASMCDTLGKLLAYPMAIIAIFFLLGAALVNVLADEGQLDAVVRYSYQVHLMSIFVDFFLSIILFRKDSYVQIKVCGMPVFALGTWFKQQCDIFELKETEHYTVHKSTVIPCCVKLVTWRRVPGVVRPLPVSESDIELGNKTEGEPTPANDKPVYAYTPIDEKERTGDDAAAGAGVVASVATTVAGAPVVTAVTAVTDGTAPAANATATPDAPAADVAATPAADAATTPAAAPAADAAATPAAAPAAPAPAADAAATPVVA